MAIAYGCAHRTIKGRAQFASYEKFGLPHGIQQLANFCRAGELVCVGRGIFFSQSLSRRTLRQSVFWVDTKILLGLHAPLDLIFIDQDFVNFLSGPDAGDFDPMVGLLRTVF